MKIKTNLTNKNIQNSKRSKGTEKEQWNSLTPSNERQNYLIGFIGHNRTGKTSMAKEVAVNWIESNDSSEVIAFDPQNKFKEIASSFVNVYEDDYKEKILSLRNCLLILDDYRMLHKRAVAEDWLSVLLHMRCEWNVDIIYITHSPSQVLNWLAYYTTHYFIFYTKAQLGTFKSKIPDYIMCKQASDLINLYVKTYGRGEYPKFPYLVVDTEEEQIMPINVDVNNFKKINSIINNKDV